jgi:hypothetical protein
MKRTWKTVLTVMLFIGIGWKANAQMAVTAPLLEGLMTSMKIDQLFYYADSVVQMVQSAQNTYNQFQNMLRMEKMAMNNLKGIADVKSYDDFMAWYNRQLYLERQAENKFKNMGVNVGGKNFRLEDISEIPNAMKETYFHAWDKEFSEKQRQEMWRKMGLSPANYTYVQTWKAREAAIAKNILTKRETVNEEYMDDMERNKDMLDRIAEDKNRPDDQKMGEKELLSMLVEVNVANNKKLNDMAMDNAEANELELARNKQEETPPNPPRLSESWDYSPFGSITE